MTEDFNLNASDARTHELLVIKIVARCSLAAVVTMVASCTYGCNSEARIARDRNTSSIEREKVSSKVWEANSRKWESAARDCWQDNPDSVPRVPAGLHVDVDLKFGEKAR